MALQIATGTITGTGAAINVGIGFVPQYVKVYNPNDSHSKWATMEWFAGMPDGHGLKGLKVVDSGSTGDASQAKITSKGISAYAGSGMPVALSGTVAVSAGSAVVTGTSTRFTTELKVNDLINIGGELRRVVDIASATSLTVDQKYAAAQSGVTALNQAGVTKGFTIGADADLNASGEVMHYFAIGQ